MKQHYPTRIKPYLLIAPALLLAVLFSYRPFILTLLNSLHTISLSGKHLSFIGLENYRRLFANPSFQASLSNTLRFTLFFVPTNIIICLSAALLTNRSGKLATLNQIFFFLPMAVGLSSSMMILKMMFNPSIGSSTDSLASMSSGSTIAMPPWRSSSSRCGAGHRPRLPPLQRRAAQCTDRPLGSGADREPTGRPSATPGLLISSTLLFVIVTNIKDAMLISSPVMILTEGGPFRSTDLGLPDVPRWVQERQLRHGLDHRDGGLPPHLLGAAAPHAPRETEGLLPVKRLIPIAATLFSLIVVFPIFYTISASFFPYADFTAIPARLLPSAPTLDNYARSFSESNLLLFLTNSLYSALVGTILRMTISIIGAYAFTFMEFRGKNILFILIVATMLLPRRLDPGELLHHPRLEADRHLPGIISITLLAPTHLLMLRQYFKTVGREYREADIIEGCSDTRFLPSSSCPSARP